MATSTEVDSWLEAHSQLTPEARAHFAVEEMRTIRNTVAPDLSPAEFQMMMAMAAKYDLDPLAHEIWGAKGKSKDGREGKTLILVGRDGLLKVARRDKAYHGLDKDVVRAKDMFIKKRSKDGIEIIHEYREGMDPDTGEVYDRGPIVGAWCQVYTHGFHDMYFFARWEEYYPKNADSWSPWTKTPSVMIEKCAIAVCLRLAYNLSGVLAEEEAARVFESDTGVEVDPPASEDLSLLVPEGQRDRFLTAYEEAQRVRPGIITPAAVEMSLRGQSDGFIEQFIARMEEQNSAADNDHDPLPEVEIVEDPTPAADAGTTGSTTSAPGQGEDSEEQAHEHLTVLHSRRRLLAAQIDALQGAGSDREATELGVELDKVEAEILKLGGTIPVE